MSLFRNLLVYNTTSPQLYLVYSTATLSNVRIDFDSTSDMQNFISSNRSSFTDSLTAVRKNIDDGFTGYSQFFAYCSNITSIDVSEFDVSGATILNQIFYYCSALVEIIGLENWDVSNVTSLNNLVAFCKSLISLDVSNWDTSSVLSMVNTFKNCLSLTTLRLDSWSFSQTTSMSDFMRYTPNVEALYILNPTFQSIKGSSYISNVGTIYVPISLVNTYKSATYWSAWADNIVGVNASGEVVEIALYFIYNSENNGLTNERIDFDTTADMKAWFDENASSLSGSLTAYRQGINDGFTDLSKFFCAGGSINTVDEDSYWVYWETYPTLCYITSLDVSNFDTTGATNMSIMFSALPKIESIVGLNNLNTSEVVNMTGIFMELGYTYDMDGNETLSDNPPAIDISAWDVSSVSTIDAMFWGARVSVISMPTFSGANLLSMTSAFSAITTQDTPLSLDLSMINTSSVIRMVETFGLLPSGSTLNISNWNTSSVIDMSYMFNYGDNISTIDISSFSYEGNPDVVSMLAYTSLDNIIGFENIPTTLPTYDRIFEVN